MLRVEQEGEDVGAVDADVDGGDVAHLDLVGDRRNRALARIEHPELDGEIVGNQRAAPAPGPASHPSIHGPFGHGTARRWR